VVILLLEELLRVVDADTPFRAATRTRPAERATCFVRKPSISGAIASTIERPRTGQSEWRPCDRAGPSQLARERAIAFVGI
jgi:hypothetical protein